MRVHVIASARYEVLAVGPKDGAPFVLDFLAGVGPNMSSWAVAMSERFERYASGGRGNLTANMFHEADKARGIWEFVCGRLRVFCFVDDGAVVILTNGGVKASRKADRGDVDTAARRKAEYLAAKAAGTLARIDDRRR